MDPRSEKESALEIIDLVSKKCEGRKFFVLCENRAEGPSALAFTGTNMPIGELLIALSGVARALITGQVDVEVQLPDQQTKAE